MVEQWNKLVKPKDRIYVLGDVAIKRSGLKILEQLNGRKVLVKGNHDCLDELTEILTDNGWKNYWEIAATDRCWSMKDGTTGCWMPITSVITREHKGEMVSIESGRLSMLMTPNHRVAFLGKSGLNYCLAHQVVDGSSKAVLKIPTASASEFAGLPVSDELLRLVAWILTDGCIGKRGQYRELQIYQSKPRGIERITKLLDDCGVKYTVTSRGIKKKGTVVCGKELKKDSLEAFVFKFTDEVSKQILELLSDEKRLPSSFMDMTVRQAKIFVRELMEGDGSWAKSGNAGGLHGKLGFLESVLTLCVTHGINASLYKVANRENYVLNVNFSKTSKRFHNKTLLQHGKLSKPSYEGIVWCISTPYANFLARRNGLPFFTGNCFKLKDYAEHFDDIRGCFYHHEFMMSHIPLHPELFEQRFKGNIHGHLHCHNVRLIDGSLDRRYFNVSVEQNNFAPFHWDEAMTWFSQ